MPQELLPMLPPITHREWVEGSGPNTRLCCPVCRFSSSLITPGSQVTSLCSGSIWPIRVRCLEWSMTTAWLTVSPDRLVSWKRTNLQFADRGSLVNLERPLRANGDLGGHFVTGHIDG